MTYDITLPDALKRARGRPAEPLQAAYDRPLTKDDIIALESRPVTTAPKQTLKKVRARHHALARLLASGMDAITVSSIMGNSPDYIKLLKQDPTFQELITHYSTVAQEAFADVHQQLANLNQEAIAILAERMEEDPDQFTPDFLLSLIKTSADRTGHGPTTTVNVNNRADILKEVLNEVHRERKGRVLSREDAAG